MVDLGCGFGVWKCFACGRMGARVDEQFFNSTVGWIWVWKGVVPVDEWEPVLTSFSTSNSIVVDGELWMDLPC